MIKFKGKKKKASRGRRVAEDMISLCTGLWLVVREQGVTGLTLSVLRLWKTGSYVLMVLKSLASSIWWGFHICETTQEMGIRPCCAATSERSYSGGDGRALSWEGPTGSRSVPKGPLWLDHPTAFSSPALLMHFTPVVLEGIFLSYFCIPMSQWTFSDIKISKSHLVLRYLVDFHHVSQTLGLLFNDMNISYPLRNIKRILKEVMISGFLSLIILAVLHTFNNILNPSGVCCPENKLTESEFLHVSNEDISTLLGDSQEL